MLAVVSHRIGAPPSPGNLLPSAAVRHYIEAHNCS